MLNTWLPMHTWILGLLLSSWPLFQVPVSFIPCSKPLPFCTCTRHCFPEWQHQRHSLFCVCSSLVLGVALAPSPDCPKYCPLSRGKAGKLPRAGTAAKCQFWPAAKPGFKSLGLLCQAPSTWLCWICLRAAVNRLECQRLNVYDAVNTNWHLPV